MKHFNALFLDNDKRVKRGTFLAEELEKAPHFNKNTLVWESDAVISDAIPARFSTAFVSKLDNHVISKSELNNYIVEPLPPFCSKCKYYETLAGAATQCSFYDTAVGEHNACIGLKLLANWKAKGIKIAGDYDEEMETTKGRPKLKK